MYICAMCRQFAVSLVDYVRTVADAFCPLRKHQPTEQLRGELHKSEVLLITSTLLVVLCICWYAGP